MLHHDGVSRRNSWLPCPRLSHLALYKKIDGMLCFAIYLASLPTSQAICFEDIRADTMQDAVFTLND